MLCYQTKSNAHTRSFFVWSKAVMNAASLVFGTECRINGCFFHFSQSIFRRVQTHGMFQDYFETKFRKTYKLLQALAFLPPDNVIEGFGMIRAQTTDKKGQALLDYFEKT
jgi:hypothetical protein